MPSCPICGDECDTTHERRIHASRSHDTTLAGEPTECGNCGTDIRRPQHQLEEENAVFCSDECETAAGDRPVLVDALGDIQIDATFGANSDASSNFPTADGGIIDGDTAEGIDDTTETETSWSRPRPEIDPFGNYTDFDIVEWSGVECTCCEVETILPLGDLASHKEHCKHTDQSTRSDPTN